MVPREMEVEEDGSDSGSGSLVASDLPKHLELLTETSKLIPAVEASVRKVRDAMLSEEEDGVVSTEAGLSLLELKNHLMLQYLSDLAYVQLLKASGGKLSGDAAVDRLVTARTVLEKIRPLESKLKHLVDKALKAAESGMVDEDDPMNARANPAALMSKFGDDESEEDEEDESDGEEGARGGGGKKEKDGKYVAPKHIPAYFADPADADSRSEETAAKEKKKLLSKSLIDDLRQQHLDTPEEVHAHEDVLKKRKIEAMRARTDYEERYMMRLPLTKKQKHSRRQMGSTIGTIANEVTQFGTSYFSEGADGKKRKKRRASQGGKKKKKFRK